MQAVNQELEHILATVPERDVIATIERLNPEWKHDLLPWQLAKPGEEIPWQAVYMLKQQPASTAGLKWAEERLAELRAQGDVG
jgi:hypothetical protein